MSTIIPPHPTMPPEVSLPAAASMAAEPDHDFPHPPTNLIDNDGVPLESDWHRLEMTLLLDTVRQHMGERRDYFAGGKNGGS